MKTMVRRITYSHERVDGRDTLQQQFRFEGTGLDADAVKAVMFGAPLVGDKSIFGSRPGEERTSDGSRELRGFSPAPGFRFDVDLRFEGMACLVRFSQPDRKVPYLQGDLLWTFSDETGGALWDEQINTRESLDRGAEPLSGGRPSLRRWLFFRLGHKQVMMGAARNIGALLDSGST